MKRTIVIVLLVLIPFVTNANLQLDSQVTCSGSLSVFASPTDVSRIECTGNLSFTGASVQSSNPFSIFSTNNMSFFDVLVSAPELSFKAGGLLLLDTNSVFAAPSIYLDANSLILNGTITTAIPTAVPVPSMTILLAIGMTVIAVRRVSKQSVIRPIALSGTAWLTAHSLA